MTSAGHDADVTEGLQAAFLRYEAAQGRPDREELVIARLALCVALLETGWTAPEAVQEQMRRDEKTLRRLRDVDMIDLTATLGRPELRTLAVSPQT